MRSIRKLRPEDLIPLGSGSRTRLATELASRDESLACLVYVLDHAGNASLMTQALRNTLRDRATRNYRTLTDIAAEMPTATALKIVPLRDEKQYFDVFAPPPSEGDPAPFALVQTPAPLMKISPANQLTTRTSLRYMFAGMHTSAKNSTLQGQVQP